MQVVSRLVARRLVPAFIATMALGLTGAAAASAATYNVTTTADTSGACTASSCSLREAVEAADAAGGASTINVPAGTYKLTIASTGSNDPTTGDLDINNNANVTINGAGSGATVLDGNNVDRLFAVQTGSSLTLSGMTLQRGLANSSSTSGGNGGAIYTDGGLTIGNSSTSASGDVVFNDNSGANGDYGGAIYADSNSTVSLTGTAFENNNAYYGGAIADQSNHLITITKSSFTGNGTADDEGGAIYSSGGGAGLTVDSSTFSANSGEYGGAIYWETNYAVSVTHSTFNGNDASYEGGALLDYDSSAMTLNYDSFVNNAAGYDGGGALYLDANASTVNTADHDLFKGNSTTDDYGGAIKWYYGSLSSSDSTYLDNNAGYGGGAIYADSGCTGCSMTLVNDTMSHNGGTDNYGGAIYVDTTTPAAINNDTITHNVAGYSNDGGGIWDDGYLTTAGYTGSGTAGIQNTVIADNTGGDCFTTFSSSFDTAGHNMDSDGSCFGGPVQPTDHPNTEPGLGQPANNGGPLAGNQTDGSALVIPTDAETSTSATVNAGTNTGCPSTDERGVTRPQGGVCDIGAFELAAATLSVKKTAVKSVRAKNAFQYTIKVSNAGPGYSTSTTLTDKLPKGEKLWGTSTSQGSCTHSGTPAKVTCNLGVIAPGSSVTVKLVVSESKTGKFKNTATAKNAQGASASGHVTTKVTSAAGGGKPHATTGAATNIRSHSATLHGHVRSGGQRTSYFFQFRRAGTSTWSVSALRYTKRNKAVALGISHLNARTTYQYRLVAINSSGTSNGAVRSFRTSAAAGPSFTG